MTLRRILLTGSRAPSTLELTRILAKAGVEVYHADSTSACLAGSSRFSRGRFQLDSPRLNFNGFKTQLARICADQSIDLLWPTCEEIFYIAAAKAELEQHCKVLAPDLAGILAVHDKYRFSQLARVNGMQSPATCLIEKGSLAQRLQMASAWLDQPGNSFDRLVLKPAYSRFATQAIIVPREAVIRRLRNFDTSIGIVLQEYKRGPLVCSYSIAEAGTLRAHAVYAAQFTEGANASLYFEPLRHERIRRQVESFVRAVKFTGQIAFDFIDSPEGPQVIECNPRLTSGIHLFHNHPDFHHIWQTDRPGVIEPVAQNPTMMGSAMVFFGLRAAVSGGYFRHWFRSFMGARDSVFQWQDPKPFFQQILVFLEFFKTAQRSSCKLIEATTHDIEWNELQTEIHLKPRLIHEEPA